MDLVINTDGASRGNPGPAAYGYIIKSTDGVILHQEGKVIGRTTNNIAEYTGVLRALKYVKDRYSKKAPHTVLVIADSELVIRQLSGEYKVKNPLLRELFDKIKSVEFDLGNVSYKHTLRSGNFISDRLANQALDQQ